MQRVAVTSLAILVLAPPLCAQQPLRVRIDRERVAVGFQKSNDPTSGAYKPGMWTPILVPLVEDEEGPIILRPGKDGVAQGEMIVDCPDYDEVQTSISTPFRLDLKGAGKKDLQILTYVKPAGVVPAFGISIKGSDLKPEVIADRPSL